MSFEVKEINEAYFNGCNFESLMRGIHFAVYISALSKIYTGPERTAQSRQLMTILVTLFFVMSTIHHAAYWAYVHRAFIARGQTAESIADSLNEYPNWYIGITSVSDLNAVLADCVIIWRCWIVWGRSWKVIIAPIITTMLTTAFSIIAIYQTVSHTTFGAVGVDYATALYSTSLATTLYCTGVIIFRVVDVGTRSRAGPGLRSYRGVLEILVESSSLYCIATLFALIAYIRSGPASEFASAFWTSITGIAPTLIVARVAAGDARPNQTWNEEGPALSFLRFNRTLDGTATANELGTMSAHTHGKSHGTRTTYVDDTETSALPGKDMSDEELHKAEKSMLYLKTNPDNCRSGPRALSRTSLKAFRTFSQARLSEDLHERLGVLPSERRLGTSSYRVPVTDSR
ncbi:hypothetical protein LshimejAT787_1900860 [Lyophyllum shimeji]|uniref:Uncharacterized protein n=1 Tax=Lyophyllum shimeji TaxID=47721 RepID=A0A9P3UTX1_LYOSH|nr:hypothetical protein LshimejAT787_1900860 [Lyophyllum shimeji]